jgi:hypothetical protein
LRTGSEPTIFRCANYCPPFWNPENPTMSRNPALNRAHQKAFYQRLKADPVLWRAFLDRRAAYKRAVRAGARPVALPTTAALIEAISRQPAIAGRLGIGPRSSVGIRLEDGWADQGGRPCR